MKLPLTPSNLSIITENACDLARRGGWEIVFKKATNRRTVDANALQAVFIKNIADYYGEEDIEEVRNWIKRYFGWPILAASPSKGAQKVRDTLGRMNFEMQPKEIQKEIINLVPVTSILSTKEHSDMLSNMQVYFAKRGLVLESITEK